MFLAYLWKTFRLVATIVLIIVFIRTFVVEIGRVDGVSMEPTMFDNQMFVVNKFFLLLRAPERGQIIQVEDFNSGELIIKRVIGLPGERIVVKENKVWIEDGSGTIYALEEPYLSENMVTQLKPNGPTDFKVLGPDEYFVMGDNRRESYDSRDFGAVKRRRVLGLVASY